MPPINVWVLVLTFFFHDGRPAERYQLTTNNPAYCTELRQEASVAATSPDIDTVTLVLDCTEERAS